MPEIVHTDGLDDTPSKDKKPRPDEDSSLAEKQKAERDKNFGRDQGGNQQGNQRGIGNPRG